MKKMYKRKNNVNQICLKTNKVLNTFKNFSEASRETKIHHNGIYMAARGIRKTAGGFKWELA